MVGDHLGLGAAEIHVIRKISRGPAFLVENGPGVGTLGNKVLPDKKRPHAPRGVFIGHLDNSGTDNGFYILFIEPAHNIVKRVRVGYRHTENRHIAGLGWNAEQSDNAGDKQNRNSDKEQPLEKRPFAPKVFNMSQNLLKKISHLFSPPRQIIILR